MACSKHSFDSQQQLLAAAWTHAKRGTLTAWSEAKVWALREVYLEAHGGKTYGLNAWIHTRVKKAGGGNPSPEAIGQLLAKIDDDEAWFPGRRYGSMGGRPKALSETNRGVIARSAMAMKENDEEPTWESVLAHNPRAAINPQTGELVTKKSIYDILKTLCHDGDPSKPWVHGARFAKGALTDGDLQKRFGWGQHIADIGHTAQFYFDKVIFTDICNSILPTSGKKAQE